MNTKVMVKRQKRKTIEGQRSQGVVDGGSLLGEDDVGERVLSGALRCKAMKTDGSARCKNPAVKGTTVCRKHGGNLPQVRAKAKRREQEQELQKVVDSLDLNDLPYTSPELALMNEVSRCAKMVEFLSDQIANLERDKLTGMMVTRITDKDGTERTVTQHVLVKALGEWSDRLTRTSKATIDADIAERTLRIAEKDAEILQAVITATLSDFNLDVGDEQVGKVVAGHIRMLTSGGHPVSETGKEPLRLKRIER